MLTPSSYQYICSRSDQIPEAVASGIRQEIAESLGQPVSLMLPELASAFPLMIAALETHWPKPIMATNLVTDMWLIDLVLARDDLNLFFNLRYSGFPISGPQYDQAHRMLPTRWRELYRSFESFTITAKSYNTVGGVNAPFTYSRRLQLEEYRQRIGTKKSKIRDFAEKIGSDNLVCWLITDAGDALFLDEKRCDHKVYHVRKDAFDEVYLLPNPDDLLDEYLAHYVSGKSSSDFDFRKAQ